MSRLIDIRSAGYDGYQRVEVRAGPLPSKRIVPPAGEAHAFDVPQWKRRVVVASSPTGRSVRVWVDGVEIAALNPKEPTP